MVRDDVLIKTARSFTWVLHDSDPVYLLRFTWTPGPTRFGPSLPLPFAFSSIPLFLSCHRLWTSRTELFCHTPNHFPLPCLCSRFSVGQKHPPRCLVIDMTCPSSAAILHLPQEALLLRSEAHSKGLQNQTTRNNILASPT